MKTLKNFLNRQDAKSAKVRQNPTPALYSCGNLHIFSRPVFLGVLGVLAVKKGVPK
jgi:hypothetical protein